MEKLLLTLCFMGSTLALLCEEARLQCAYREGCGAALQNYLVSCKDLQNYSSDCPEECQNALIALTSTLQGKHLMTCECGDRFCAETKDRVEVCRPYVLRAMKNETIVSCTVAQRICGADPLCSKALEYYNLNCRAMFVGKRCSSRCENSINILRRQEKAAKLNNCFCNGREDYDCDAIRSNMEKLCFNKSSVTESVGDIETNQILVQHNVFSSATSNKSYYKFFLSAFLLVFRFTY